MAYETLEGLSGFLNEVAEKVIQDITMDAYDYIKTEIVNKGYINNTQSGSVGDLMNRDYISYFNGSGTPTFQFYDSFKWVRDSVKEHMSLIFYDSSEASRGGHTVSANELYDLAENGEIYSPIARSTNEGGFEESIKTWLESNFDSMAIDGFKKYGIDLS